MPVPFADQSVLEERGQGRKQSELWSLTVILLLWTMNLLLRPEKMLGVSCLASRTDLPRREPCCISAQRGDGGFGWCSPKLSNLAPNPSFERGLLLA